MTRIVSLLAVPALALFTASCGCPQKVQPPSLPNMPKFQELPAAEGEDIPVVPTK